MEDFFDLVSNTADGALALNREQRIIFWNEAAEALLGFTVEDALGRFCYEVICGRDESGRLVCHRECRDVMAAIRQEPVPTHDILVRTKAGREVWLSVSSILIPSHRSGRCVLVHLFRNVSRQKELERCVQQLVSSVVELPSARAAYPPVRLSPCRSPCPSAGDLTRREREVLGLLASGVSSRAIAEQLFISPSTVRNHVHNILAKLGVHSQLEAVSLTLRNGLIREGHQWGGPGPGK